MLKEQRISGREFLRKEEAKNYWMFDECNYVFEAETPPDKCPDFHAKCTFMNVSCYIPDCGGPGNYDPKLVAQRDMKSGNKLN